MRRDEWPDDITCDEDEERDDPPDYYQCSSCGRTAFNECHCPFCCVRMSEVWL